MVLTQPLPVIVRCSPLNHRRSMSDTVWRARPLFITSTFRDMHAERDHLRNFVFPIIDERLRERREYLEPIDLRQGVEALEDDQAHARELQVLNVCLEEVERSRPFLLGLLGDRYGWVPPEARMRAAALEAGFDGEITGRSVTELEIAFGVLADSGKRQRSLFYFREPLPYASMSSTRAAEFPEAYNDDPDSTKGTQKLAALKNRLVEALPGQCRTYSADWDPKDEKVANLKTWGEQVVMDLWRELDAETHAGVPETPASWQNAERWVLEQFIEERARTFIGRGELLDSLLDFAGELNPQYLTHLFSTFENVGFLYQSRNDYQDAKRLYKLALKVAQEAVTQFPSEPYWQQSHCTTGTRLADTSLADGDVDEAISELKKVLEIAVDRAASNRDDEYWRRVEWTTHYRLATALEPHDWALGMSHWNQAYRCLTKLCEDGYVLSTEDAECLSSAGAKAAEFQDEPVDDRGQ